MPKNTAKGRVKRIQRAAERDPRFAQKGKRFQKKAGEQFRFWKEEGENRGRRATGANTIDVPVLQSHAGDCCDDKVCSDVSDAESREKGCWTHADELRGLQMTTPHWIGPTPLSSLPPGWRMVFDEEYRQPFFWHEDNPDETTWEDPRTLHGSDGRGGDSGDEHCERASCASADEENRDEKKDAQADVLQDFLDTAPPLPEAVMIAVREAASRRKTRKKLDPLTWPAFAKPTPPPGPPPAARLQSRERSQPRDLLRPRPSRRPPEAATDAPAAPARDDACSRSPSRARSRSRSPVRRSSGRPVSSELRSRRRSVRLRSDDVLRGVGLNRAAEVFSKELDRNGRGRGGRRDDEASESSGISLRVLLLAVEEALHVQSRRDRRDMLSRVQGMLNQDRGSRSVSHRSSDDVPAWRR
eukprot:TRINITY_DN64144_c0_g1_i1.p1 TRINITY_DN64144_c0_g1~~TRINITY_DN64144_c0_g1_i1.p1  ORF type:complete len:413 (+),score=57.47 TRINITY_DN64144_c0_g1_i1:114-1352(+)